MAQEIERLVVKVTGDTGDYHRKLAAAEAATKGAGVRMSALGRNLMAGLGLTSLSAALLKVTNDARTFSAAMAEVSTLLDDLPGQMNSLTASVRQMSREFGKDRVEQARALYQIISAGASSAAAATSTLVAANKLAVGGVTDVATAADGLTSIMNAYGSEVGAASDVSDALFVAMRAGKTTIAELSSNIGRIAPLAAQAGVSLEEVLAASAALTKGGLDTGVAVRGLNQVLARIVKPTAQAAETAEELGLQFNAATLESLGLQGMLEQIIDKSGGSTEKLGLLFEGVESLIPVLALAGGASEDFAAIMADMGTRAGETEKAYKKVAESADHRLSVATERLKDHMVDLGNASLTNVVPAMEGVADVMDGVAHRFGQATEKVGEFAAAIDALRNNPASRGLDDLFGWLIDRGVIPADFVSEFGGPAAQFSGIGGSGGGAALGPLANPAILAAIAAAVSNPTKPPPTSDPDEAAKEFWAALAEAMRTDTGLSARNRLLPLGELGGMETGRVSAWSSTDIVGTWASRLRSASERFGVDIADLLGEVPEHLREDVEARLGANGPVASEIASILTTQIGQLIGGSVGRVMGGVGGGLGAIGTFAGAMEETEGGGFAIKSGQALSAFTGAIGAVGALGSVFQGLTDIFDGGKSATERFIESLNQATHRLRTEFAVFGTEASERFDAIVQLMLDQLPDQFDRFFEGVTPENLEERFAEFLAWVDSVGPVGEFMWGPFIDSMMDAFGNLAGEVDKTTGSFRALNAPSGFNLAWFRDQAGSMGLGGGSGLPEIGDGRRTRPTIDIGSVTVVGTGDPRETWENFKRALRYGSSSGDPLGRDLALGVT